MAYYYSRKLKTSFDEVLAKTTRALRQQGFGIMTTVDMKDILKENLDTSFRNYKILSVCNPLFSYKAISLESHIGLMLPCNIVVQEHENGEVEVSALNPMEALDDITSTPLLTDLALEISNRLRTALDSLHRNILKQEHEEAIS